MAVTNPIISGTLTDINSVATSSTTSTLVAKGAAVPMSNNILASAWVPVDTLDPSDGEIFYELDLTPSYEGQLFWSAVSGTFPSYVATSTSAGLYISVHYTKIQQPLPTFYNEFIWVPVKLEGFGTYIDPATGRTWDPVGAYTCNPPYLCAE